MKLNAGGGISILLCYIGLILCEVAEGQCKKRSGVCDQWSPCCGSEGWCGSSYQFCGPGCHQGGNFGTTKCLPLPSCQVKKISLSPTNVVKKASFKGDIFTQDFTVEGEYKIEDGVVILKMRKGGGGATMFSTRFINYGRVSAELKSDRGPGLVTSFITMSLEKDEIDWEWTGSNKRESQTNWYYRGVNEDYSNAHPGFYNNSVDTTEWHTYTIDWSPTKIVWSIDNKVLRTQLKEESKEPLPDTPSYFSIGIWNGGDSGAPGTVKWAGGETEWDTPTISELGYYSIQIRGVAIEECTGTPTSKDSEFEVDNQFGLINKGPKPKSKTPTNIAMNTNYISLSISMLVISIPYLYIN